MKVIGIDIGTTSICGILLDARTGNVLRSVTHNSNAFLKTPHEWEKIQDTQKIIRMARSIVDELITEDVKAIGITGQMHGIVYYDENGRAVSPLYTWQDGRGNRPYGENGTYSDFLKIPSGYGAVTDFYNTQNGLRPASAVGYCTVGDLLTMTLSGRKTPLIHTSDAASFGGFDLTANRFSRPFAGEMTGGFAILGEYRGIPVSVAIGDNQASVFGAIRDDGDILMNIGTGSQISVNSPEIVTAPGIETRPYMEGKFLAVGAALCGGRAYSMLEKFFAEVVFAATGERVDMYAVMEKMGLSDSIHLRADTRFSGTRQDPSVTGSITGITTENFTPGELRGAIMTGMISELYDLFTRMNAQCCALVGSGNGLRRNRDLVRIAEEIFGVKMRIPRHREEAAFGAALFAMTATGLFGSVQDVKRVIQYEPLT